MKSWFCYSGLLIRRHSLEALHTIGQIDIFENIRDSHTFLVLGMITAVRTVITD